MYCRKYVILRNISYNSHLFSNFDFQTFGVQWDLMRWLSVVKGVQLNPYQISKSSFKEVHLVMWYDICKMVAMLFRPQWVNTFRPWQNGCHFEDDTFKCISLNENAWMSYKISLKFVPWGPIMPALVQIMAWHWLGDKPLSKPMMITLPTHICASWPQWVNVESAPICLYFEVCRHGSQYLHILSR